MFTDMVGFTALTQSDERQSLEVLDRHNRLLRPFFSKFHGREVKAVGDSFLVEFESALDATSCAVEIQRFLHDYNLSSRDEWRITLRIGIHLGDVVRSGDDILGDAVNIASRLQPLAEPEGICLSDQVYGQVRNKMPQNMVKLEPHDLKGVKFTVDAYKVVMPWEKPAEESSARDRNRVAVLPFANMSPDSGDEYFADGMTEEMISTLSKLPGIEVISRTSVMQYKRATKPIKEVFKELNSGTVLEGSVRKADGRVRITVQMVDAQRDRHLWAESYDRDLNDIFEVQSEVAELVAGALRIKLLPSASDRIHQRPTNDSSAYTLYLQGRHYWNMRGLDDVKKAMDCFESAVTKDPKFALGYVGLGDCHAVLATRFEADVEENWKKSRAAVAKALALDPGLAEAHASRGVALIADYDLHKAEEEFRTAIELKPSYASAHQWYAQLLIARLSWDEALSHIEKAAELDPFSQIISMVHTFLYEAKRDYGNGLRLAERAAELNPNDAGCRIELAYILGKMRMFEEMQAEAQIGLNLIKKGLPFADKGLDTMVAYLRGDKKKVGEMLPELKEHLGETFTTVRFIADLHFYLGEVDDGFEWLEKSYSDKEFDLIYIKSDEFLDGVRKDKRYLTLVDKLGLS